MEPFLRVPNNSMVTLTEGITTTTKLTHPSINTNKENSNSTNLKSILVSSCTAANFHNERHVQFDLVGLAQQLHSRLPRYPKRPFWRNKKQDILDEALFIKDFRYKIEQSQREIDEEFPGWVDHEQGQQFNFTVLKRTTHCSSEQPSEEFRDIARGLNIGRKTMEQVLAEKPTIPTKLKKVDFRRAMRDFNKRFGLPQDANDDDNDDAFSFVESSDPANIDLDLEIIDFDDVVYVDARETVEEEQETSEQTEGEFHGSFEDVQTLKEEQEDQPNDVSESDYFQVVPPTQFELDQDEQFFQDMIVVVEENDPRFDPNYQSSESDSSDSSDGVKVVADFHVVCNN
ncbi:hypothetical protein WICPIJ_003131 [Wickerhamomyces pijperi]|uniref:Uncharacterized protein n=1 Tax=Wickerhamomyces pijperi TaxID=599730 RepID=A0A9P8TNA3_WICPI|nr:hypothetical protein WICPIJ_003131 [Wickerhamomyces pijperi]